MSRMSLLKICIALGAAIAATGTAVHAQSADEAGLVVDVTGPLVLGFFPPMNQAAVATDDGGLRDGVTNVNIALQELAKCLAPLHPTVRFEFTRYATLRSEHRTDVFPLPGDWGHAVGLILALPNRPAEIVYATAGPESLKQLAPYAAAEYFGVAACRPTS